MNYISLRELLGKGIFLIPNYQRGYSWTKTQLREFIEDLEDSKQIKEHYTGTITLVKRESKKISFNSYNCFEVVDGQQRITTIILLLNSIFYRYKELKNEVDDDIKRDYSIKGRLKVNLNSKKDADFLLSLTNESKLKDAQIQTLETKTQKNLFAARLYFDKYLSQKKITELRKLYDDLLQKFKVNIFELTNELEVGLVFETMNDRGLSLSDIDKVKNYLIYLCGRLDNRDLAKEVNKKFGEIFSELMKVESKNSITEIENLFLRKAYTVYTGETKELSNIHKKVKIDLIPKSTKRELQTKLQFTQNNNTRKANEIQKFAAFLLTAAKNFVKIYNHKFSDKELNLCLKKLKAVNKLENFSPLVLAMSVSKNFKVNHIAVVCSLIEVFTIRVHCFGKSSIKGINQIQKASNKVYEGNLRYNDLKKTLKKLVVNNTNTRTFKNAIVNSEAYKSVDKSILKYFLVMYEFSLDNTVGEMQILDLFFKENSKISIEHIFPQTPSDNKSTPKNIDSIGNLVITKRNQLLQNRNFKSKKKALL